VRGECLLGGSVREERVLWMAGAWVKRGECFREWVGVCMAGAGVI